MQYERLKRLEARIPAQVREPLQRVWRRALGTPEYRVARHLSDKTKVAVDVGAGDGAFAEVLARACLRCEAFEANPANWPALRDNLSSLNAEVHECAVSDHDGDVVLRVPIVTGVDNRPLSTIEESNDFDGAAVRATEVPCRRLDGFDLGRVGFMKIDVEGHEQAVLRGAAELLARDKPNLLVEVEERHRSGAVEGVTTHLRELGYHAYFLLGRHLLPFSDFDVSVHQDPDSVELSHVLPGKVYANSFVFVSQTEALKDLLGKRL